jgi:hypothetical protein
MVIDDLDIVYASFGPAEANAPLAIHPDAPARFAAGADRAAIVAQCRKKLSFRIAPEALYWGPSSTTERR